jgi:hypothetical protein
MERTRRGLKGWSCGGHLSYQDSNVRCFDAVAKPLLWCYHPQHYDLETTALFRGGADLYQARATRVNYSYNIMQTSCQAGRRGASARQAPAQTSIAFLPPESTRFHGKI